MTASFGAILVLALFAANPGEGGKVRKFGIVGGKETTISEFPYQVAYLFNGKLKCGASIISSKCILTAAHCANNYGSNLTVRVGSTNKDSGGTVYKIKRALIHPNFNAGKLVNDSALLFVDGEILFDANVKPIAPADPYQVIPDGTKCTVSGWGKMEDDKRPEKLRSVDVEIVNRGTCQKSYNSPPVRFQITNEMICAGYLEGGRDACTGDSGGPMVCNIGGKKLQVGIVSSGYGCALPRYVGIYAEVSKFWNWINDKCKLPSL